MKFVCFTEIIDDPYDEENTMTRPVYINPEMVSAVGLDDTGDYTMIQSGKATIIVEDILEDVVKRLEEA